MIFSGGFVKETKQWFVIKIYRKSISALDVYVSMNLLQFLVAEYTKIMKQISLNRLEL